MNFHEIEPILVSSKDFNRNDSNIIIKLVLSKKQRCYKIFDNKTTELYENQELKPMVTSKEGYIKIVGYLKLIIMSSYTEFPNITFSDDFNKFYID